MRYLESSKSSHVVSWKATYAWISEDFNSRKIFFPQLIRLLKIQNFPFEYVHGKILKESILQDEQRLQVVEQWFSNYQTAKSQISVSNYYDIRSTVLAYEVPDKSRYETFLDQFFAQQFQQLFQKPEFLELSEKEILPVFQNTDEEQHFSETTKWEAAVKWVKHDESRKKLFPTLFSLVNLQLIPTKFVKESIRNELLVNKSPECKDTLLQHFCENTMLAPLANNSPECKDILLQHFCENTKLASYIMCLDKANGEITSFDPSSKKAVLFSHKPGGIGICNIKGILYLALNERLHRLNRNGTWALLPPSPFAISAPCKIFCFQNCVYIIDTKFVQSFDPMSNIWHCRSMDGLDGSTCVAATEDTIYALGGTSGLWMGSDEAKSFIPSIENTSWSSITRMKYTRSHAAATALRETVWVMGGGRKSVEFYQPASRTWTDVPEMIFARKYFTSCVLNGRIYVIGGTSFDANLAGSDSIESYDEESREWKIVETIKRRNSGFCCCSCSPPKRLKKMDELPQSSTS